MRLAVFLVMCGSSMPADALQTCSILVSSRKPPFTPLRPTRTAVVMLDASLAAVATGSAELPSYVYNDPHTLANIVPDMFNSAAVAALGLMGAYVTRVSCPILPSVSCSCALTQP
jgi:hypothetical protein